MSLTLSRLQHGGILTLALLLTGCATATDPRDPFEPVNRGIYKFNDTVDKAVIKPVAKGYKAVLPNPVRNGVTNFFANIDDLLIAFNNALQFKFGKAVSDVGRIMVNTTFGVAGIFDVASGWGLEKHDEDFGQTLGYWGVGDGPFLMLPFLGPSNVRDTVGLVAYYRLDPVVNLGNVPARNSLSALRFVDRRARLLDAEKVLDEAALDPYIFLRDAYIQHRRSAVYDGNPPREKLEDDILDEPAKQPDKQSEAAEQNKVVEGAPTEAPSPQAITTEAAAPATPETATPAEASLVAGDGSASGRQE
jgi:phospholipid-binding lipoprotein MlaA